jgi:ribosome-binding protein aMBF1 (putative translation factor)
LRNPGRRLRVFLSVGNIANSLVVGKCANKGLLMSDGSANREEVAQAVQDALRNGPFSLRDLAEEMEGSYGTLREWSRGARNPTDENVERIAASLESRARILLQLAEQLRNAVGQEDG